MQTPAQDSRSVPGLLYPTAVQDDRCEQEHCQGPVDIDPPLVSYRHDVGYRRSPGNLASPVTRLIGCSRMSLWSGVVVSLSAAESYDGLTSSHPRIIIMHLTGHELAVLPSLVAAARGDSH
jgi:hypothetical protein